MYFGNNYSANVRNISRARHPQRLHVCRLHYMWRGDPDHILSRSNKRLGLGTFWPNRASLAAHKQNTLALSTTYLTTSGQAIAFVPSCWSIICKATKMTCCDWLCCVSAYDRYPFAIIEECADDPVYKIIVQYHSVMVICMIYLLAMFVVGSVPCLLLSSLLQQTFCQILKTHVGTLVKI